MKDLFNLKNEALFMCIVSHSAHILDNKDSKYDTRIYSIAKHVSNYFKKIRVKRYTNKRAIALKNFLKEHIEPLILDNSNSAVHLLVTIDYLIKDIKHIETMKMFSVHKNTISTLLVELESTSHREIVFNHYKKISEILDVNVNKSIT